MVNYKQVADKLKEKTSYNKKYDFTDMFYCNYCPSTHHRLCNHKDKCLLNEDVQNTLLQIGEINSHINWIKCGKITEELQQKLNELIIQRKRLFRKYYTINTEEGDGYGK